MAFFTTRESLRPVPVSFTGHTLLVDSSLGPPGSEEARESREYLLPPYPNGYQFTFLLVSPLIVMELISVESDSILFAPLSSDPWSRLTARERGTLIHVFGVDNLWFIDSNMPLVGTL